ncbi:leptin-like [Thunnus albacares]|uniref:leptin-like n=1 Tax=Thunnus albacares TaxID=8236 RepID=UPI001CF6A3BF|nr:leptin-like [Thunnus albacares]
MDYSIVAILFSLLHVFNVGTAAPLPVEVEKAKVERMAKQLIVKLNKDFQGPPGRTLTSPADNLDGLSSIVMVLEGYNNLISENFNGVSQVKSEISSLTGYLDQRVKGSCSKHLTKTSVPGPLQELQSRKAFIHTVSIEALMRVKQVLNQLLKNMDHLKTC